MACVVQIGGTMRFRQICVWCALPDRLAVPHSFFAPVKARNKGKRRNHGRRQHRRSPAATARRRLQGGECLRGAVRGLLARRPVRRVLLATAAKIFFEVNVPRPLRQRCCRTPHSTLHGACTGSLPRLSAPRAPPSSRHRASTTCSRTSGRWCTRWATST